VEGATNTETALITALSAAVSVGSVVNAASFRPGLAPGAIATIYGASLSESGAMTARTPWPDTLANVQVFLQGRVVPLLYVSDSQINFLAPMDLPQGSADLVVATASGRSAAIPVPVSAVAPGIFFDTATSFGAVLNAGTFETTHTSPAPRGGYIEIYCTGLGAVRNSGALMETLTLPEVHVGSTKAQVIYSGLAPGYQGLYQVNVQVPEAVAAGRQTLSITINGVRSNEVAITLR